MATTDETSGEELLSYDRTFRRHLQTCDASAEEFLDAHPDKKERFGTLAGRNIMDEYELGEDSESIYLFQGGC